MRRVLVALILLGGCGIRQKFSLEGTWTRGGISGDHFGTVVLSVTEQGDRVIGRACKTSSGHLVFRDVPVSGRYPHVTFDVADGRYTGAIISEDTITGAFQRAGSSQEWVFKRSPSSDYEGCRSAQP